MVFREVLKNAFACLMRFIINAKEISSDQSSSTDNLLARLEHVCVNVDRRSISC